MIGTLFLWMYWPSFNGALGSGSAQHRVIINTYLCLTCSCIAACWTARCVKGKLEIEILLNATLSGGVALGSSADIIANPYGAMLVGTAAGITTAIGYAFCT
jgi:ammonium transporter Rh